MSETKETWFLIRGLNRESAHWGGFVDALKSLGPGVDVQGLDLPGTGKFRKIKSPTSLSEIVRFLDFEYGEQVRSAPSPQLLAISLGAMVAMEWLKQTDHPFGSGVLINTSDGATPWFQRFKPRNLFWGAEYLFERGLEKKERFVLKMTTARPDQYTAELKRRIEIARERPVDRANVFRQLAAAASFRAEKLSVPGLLLASEGDRFTSPQASRRLADKLSLACHIHPWAGHDLPLEDPMWIVKQISAWRSAMKTP